MSATIDQTGHAIAPSLIGFNVDGHVVGVRDAIRHMAGKISWNGLLKAGAATGIAAAATAVKAGYLALDEIQYSRGQMAGDLVKMQVQRDGAVNRAAHAEARLAEKVRRWSPEEKAFVARQFGADGRHPTYALIATLMEAEFGRHLTAAAVGVQARKLVKAGRVPVKAKAPSRKAR